MHHKRCATTSGSLARPPEWSLLPSPRGVGNAWRCFGIAGAPFRGLTRRHWRHGSPQAYRGDGRSDRMGSL